jgi:hypothetical protein
MQQQIVHGGDVIAEQAHRYAPFQGMRSFVERMATAPVPPLASCALPGLDLRLAAFLLLACNLSGSGRIVPPVYGAICRGCLMYRRRKSEAVSYLAWLFGSLVLASICYYGMTRYSRLQDSRLQVVAQATTDRPPAVQNPAPQAVKPDGQASPQAPTGPLETKSGGAPEASPQGDTPSGMQAVPGGSAETTRQPSK